MGILIEEYNVSDLPVLEEELQAAVSVHNKYCAIVKEIDGQDNPDTDERAAALKSVIASANAIQRLRDKIKILKDAKDNRTLIDRLQQITEKNDCLRVRFYDWLATKLEHLAARIRNHAMKISTPCVVKLPTSKTTDDNSFLKKSKKLRDELTVMAKEHAKKEAEYKQLLSEIQKLKQGK